MIIVFDEISEKKKEKLIHDLINAKEEIYLPEDDEQ